MTLNASYRKPILIKHKGKAFDFDTETEDKVRSLESNGHRFDLQKGHRLKTVDAKKLTEEGVKMFIKDKKVMLFNKTHMMILEKLSQVGKIISSNFPGKFFIKMDERQATDKGTPFWIEAATLVKNTVLDIYNNFSVQIGCGRNLKLAYITQLLRDEGKSDLCQKHLDLLYLSSINELPDSVPLIHDWEKKVNNITSYAKFKNKIDVYYKNLTKLNSFTSIFKFFVDEIKRIERILDNQTLVMNRLTFETGEHTLKMDYDTYARSSKKEINTFLAKKSIKNIASMKITVFYVAAPEPPDIDPNEWKK